MGALIKAHRIHMKGVLWRFRVSGMDHGAAIAVGIVAFGRGHIFVVRRPQVRGA